MEVFVAEEADLIFAPILEAETVLGTVIDIKCSVQDFEVFPQPNLAIYQGWQDSRVSQKNIEIQKFDLHRLFLCLWSNNIVHGKAGLIYKPLPYPKDSPFYTGDHKIQAVHPKLLSILG